MSNEIQLLPTKIVDYTTVTSSTPYGVGVTIKREELLENGWEPHGSMGSYPNPNGDMDFYQPMVKRAELTDTELLNSTMRHIQLISLITKKLMELNDGTGF